MGPDDDRRAEARIPDEVGFKTKPQLALDMIRRAVDADLPRGTVVADEGYGNSAEFREGCRRLGLDFAWPSARRHASGSSTPPADAAAIRSPLATSPGTTSPTIRSGATPGAKALASR